jgi:hypothetical protein
MYRKAQTATEYLIILAVVVVIALIVIGVLGGIPFIGGGAATNANKAALLGESISISQHSVGCDETIIFLKNQKPDAIQIQNITLGDITCLLEPVSNPLLKPGESKKLYCRGYLDCTKSSYDADLIISYKDITSGAIYSEAGTLSGNAATHSYTDTMVEGTAFSGGNGSSSAP